MRAWIESQRTDFAAGAARFRRIRAAEISGRHVAGQSRYGQGTNRYDCAISAVGGRDRVGGTLLSGNATGNGDDVLRQGRQVGPDSLLHPRQSAGYDSEISRREND